MHCDKKREAERLSSYSRILLHISSLSEDRQNAVKEINELNMKLKDMALKAVEEDKKKNSEILEHFEKVVADLRQKHLQTIDGLLKSLAEKDKRISILNNQAHMLQTNNALLESQAQSVRATLSALRQERKQDPKKELDEVREQMAAFTKELAEERAKFEQVKEDNKRYRKEREDYRDLNEKAAEREKELNEQLAQRNFEIGKLKSRLENVSKDTQEQPRQSTAMASQRKSMCEERSSLKQISLLVQSIQRKCQDHADTQMLHEQLKMLHVRNQKLEEENRRVCQQISDMRLKYESAEYMREISEHEPTLLEYLLAAKQRVGEFEQRLQNNSDGLARFIAQIDRVYNQDLLRMAESEDKNENGVVAAQRIADFYRVYLNQYSAELGKIISKRSSTRKETRALSTCCRCATVMKSESTRRCVQCQNTCHTNCIGLEYQLLFGCLNIKHVSQLPSDKAE